MEGSYPRSARAAYPTILDAQLTYSRAVGRTSNRIGQSDLGFGSGYIWMGSQHSGSKSTTVGWLLLPGPKMQLMPRVCSQFEYGRFGNVYQGRPLPYCRLSFPAYHLFFIVVHACIMTSSPPPRRAHGGLCSNLCLSCVFDLSY